MTDDSALGRVEGDTRGPRLSIVVLTWNRPHLLAECLRSLTRQTCPAEQFEIIVADDGSDDATRSVVVSFARTRPNLRHVRHFHRGIAATRNLGIRHGRGPLVAIVADDYVLDPSYAERVIEFFRTRPDAEIVRFDVVRARDDAGSRISHAYYRASLLRRLGAPSGRTRRLADPPPEPTTEHELDASGAAAFRREVFDRIGVFDESFARAEDSDLTARLRREGIAIYFDGNHAVRHQYDPYMRDTLAKSWQTGWYRYHYRRKNAELQPRLATASGLVAQKTLALRAALRELRRDGGILWLVVGLPFLALFELTNKAGFACSWLRDRLARPARLPPS